MQVVVEIPEELAAQARSRGFSVESYVRNILEQAVVVPKLPVRKKTRAELEAFFEAFAQFSDKVPDLSGKSFDREMIYQDHN